MNEELKSFCVWIVRIGTCAILFLPLLVIHSAIYPYIFGKMIFLQVCVELIFLAWIPLALADTRYRPSFRNPLTLTLTLFMGAICVSALAGIYPAHSFWSNQERMVGVIGYLHFYAWYIAVSTTQREWKDWRLFFIVSMIASFLVGFIGLAENVTTGTERIIATLGNALYVGSYSLFHILIGIALVVRDRSIQIRVFTGLITLFNLYVLVLSGSRSVSVVFVFSLFACILAIIFLSRKRVLKFAALAVCLVMGVSVVSGYVWLQTDTGHRWADTHLPAGLKRITTNVFNASDRILLWKTGFEGFKERPLFGWGLENYNLIYNKYYDPKSAQILTATWYDRAHNQLVDILVLTGVVGFVAYVSVWLALLLIIIRFLRREPHFRNKLSIVVIGLLLLGYFIQNLSGFDSPVTLIILFLAISFIHYATTVRASEEGAVRTDRAIHPVFLSLYGILFIATPLYMYHANIKPLMASVYTVQGFSAAAQDQPRVSYEAYKKAFALHSFADYEIKNFFAEDVVYRYPSGAWKDGEYARILQEAKVAIDANIKESPLDAKGYVGAGVVYRKLTELDQSYGEAGEAIMKKALAFSPRRSDLREQLIEIYAAQSKFKEVVALQKELADDYPARPFYLFKLSVYYARMGDMPQALKTVRSIATAGRSIYGDTSFWNEMTHWAKTPEDVHAILSFIQEGEIFHPENKEYLALDAVMHGRIHDKKRVDEVIALFKKKYPDALDQLISLTK